MLRSQIIAIYIPYGNPCSKSGLFKAIFVKTRKTCTPLVIFRPFPYCVARIPSIQFQIYLKSLGYVVAFCAMISQVNNLAGVSVISHRIKKKTKKTILSSVTFGYLHSYWGSSGGQTIPDCTSTSTAHCR